MAQLPIDEATNRFKENEDRFDTFVNDETGYTSSGGQHVESLPEFLERIETTGAIAITESNKNDAESAAVVAQIQAHIYSDTSSGLAATVEGDYFSVPSSENDEYLILYLHDTGGVASQVKIYNLNESKFDKNKRIYDLKNRIRFVNNELDGPFYSVDLSDRPALIWSVNVNNELEFTGVGKSSRPELFWLGHVWKRSKNTEITMRVILDAPYTGGSTAGPGPMVYFGNGNVKGYLFAESGRITGFDGNFGGSGEYGSTLQDANAIFEQGEEVEIRIVFRSNGTGFVIGKRLLNDYELRLDLNEANLANFTEGKIWVAYNRDTPERVTHFEVNELEIIPEDFNQEQVKDNITSLQNAVSILEQTSGEKTVLMPYPNGFAMYQNLNFEIRRGLVTKSIYTTFDKENFKLASTNEIHIDPLNGNDSNSGDEENPLATVRQAVLNANSSGAVTTIYFESGEYDYQNTGNLPAFNVDVNLICKNVDACEITTSSLETGWVQDLTYTNLYYLSLVGSEPVNCYDKALLDEYGNPKGLIERTLLDANDTPGSYYISGNIIYVHTEDGRQPDSNFRIVRNLPLFDFSNKLFYMENITTRGGNLSGAIAPSHKNGDCCIVNCSFTHNAVGRAFRWVRNAGSRLISYRSQAAWAKENDGFSYTSAGSGTDVVEIENYGNHNGLQGGTTHNGSTAHTATRIIRINCNYSFNNNKNVADVSLNTQSWNIGVFSEKTYGDNSTNSVNFAVGSGAEMWIDFCSSEGGSIVDFEIGSGSTMRVRNTDLYLKNNTVDGTLESY